ncbi:MAG: hypothetical protein SFW62_01965 [Alphaproteobacteria bacterium]|nr:hypothetical protein [Alphaproteobacteria bacterium]
MQGHVACIVDHGGKVSVASDGATIIHSLLSEGITPAPRKFIYRNLEGEWGELIVREGKFQGSRLLGTRLASEAKAIVQQPFAPSQPERPSGAWGLLRWLVLGD